MADERVDEKNTEIDANQYISAITEMQNNMVSKDSYNKLKEDNDKLLNKNKELLNSILTNSTIEVTESKDMPTRAECYKKYQENRFNTDLDFWKNFLELRDATVKEYGKDPCITGNYNISVDTKDPKTGERITIEAPQADYDEVETINAQMDLIKSFVEQSNGDARKFKYLMGESVR